MRAVAVGLLLPLLALRLGHDLPPGPGINLTADFSAPGPSAGGLILLRIQKTGTTTFGDRIMNRMCAAQGKKCDVYWHVDWNWAAKLPYFHDRAIVTWIRHPIERVYSEFQYVRNVGASQQVQWDYTPEQHSLVQKATTFEQFLKIPDNPALNRMTRYLLGFTRPRTVSCPQDCGPVWAQFFKEKNSSPGAQIRVALSQGTTTAQIMKVVKSRLDKSISLLGITDCYDASLVLLGTQLGWNVPAMVADAQVHYRAGGKNQTATSTEVHRKVISPAVANLAVQKNALDLQVFQYAHALVSARMKPLGQTCVVPPVPR